MTRQEIEEALDRGLVEAQVKTGRWWRLRRNGKTRTWKTRPAEFRIPVKAGLKLCGYIDHTNMNNDELYRVVF
jgi:hypothetical protein